MKYVAGLDLSLRSTGLVVLNEAGEPQEAKAISCPGSGIERMSETAIKVIYEVDLHWPILCVIEGYAYAATQQVAGLAELGGAVKLLLSGDEIPFITVPPSRVKKFVCRGNAKKDEMRLAVYKRWGFEHKSNDVVDAYALAQLGRAVLGWEDELTKAQREVVEAVKGTEEFKKLMGVE